MEAKQGLILVICLMIIAGEVACFPKDVRAQTYLSDEDAAALAKYEDWRTILKHVPGFVKKWLLPIFKVVLKGILEKEDPLKIMLRVISELQGGEKEKEKEKEKETEKEKEKEKGETDNKPKEGEPDNEGSGSGDQNSDSQENISGNGANKFNH